MKRILSLLTMVLFFTSCYGQQSKAMKDQQKAYQILNKVADGRLATAAGSWTMTANINGKVWKANFMYGVEETARIIGHYNEDFIDLPYKRNKMTAGSKIKLGDNNGVNINLTDGEGLYGADDGEMVITNANGKWVEGVFNCSATSLSSAKKKLIITDGFFRIQLTQ